MGTFVSGTAKNLRVKAILNAVQLLTIDVTLGCLPMKKLSMRSLLLSLSLCALTTGLWAQTVNAPDECIDAILLEDVTQYCSGPEAFANNTATQSLPDYPTCVPNNQLNNDVWFQFVAQGTDVANSVTGRIPNFPGGTLFSPQFVLYGGDCDNLTELGCVSDNSNSNKVNGIFAGLEIGQTYYINVGARQGRTGSFELCVRNFNAAPSPEGDCPTGVILCDKNSFVVPSLTGNGFFPDEIDDNIPCNRPATATRAGCITSEDNSSWYKWTCDQPGSLTFTLTPLDNSDDLDFVLYELPDGINDCTTKEYITCMTSGENVGDAFKQWFPCTGATGLSENDPDNFEQCGCEDGNNNFVSAIQMEAGKSYALVVMNFTSSGSGFSIEFGGTGTFLGPTADFTATDNEVCVGESITFQDNSSFIGSIDTYRWNFGSTAIPSTATGPGPHEVVYTRPGDKAVVLQVETEDGCLVTEIKQDYTVICCETQFATGDALVSDVACPNSTNGRIETDISSSISPITYLWSTGATTPTIQGLSPGTYSVTVTDESSCTFVQSYTIDSPPPYQFDTLVVMPTCDGGTDGAVTLEVSGGTAPYEFNFANLGFTPSNTLSNISQGDYPVTVRDGNGCEVEQVLEVRELQLVLNPQLVSIREPSCFGLSNGRIEVGIANGQPAYEFSFDGGPFQGQNVLDNIPAGDYQLVALDANRCRGEFSFSVAQPDPLEPNVSTTDISCFGLRDGAIRTAVSGGTPGYQYSWSVGSSDPALQGLPAGTYALTVTDQNGCTTELDTTLTQPDELFLELGPIVDNVCFGEQEGVINVGANGGTAPYQFAVAGRPFVVTDALGGLAAGDYQVIVQDALGCFDTLAARIEQPAELLIFAEPTVEIDLGFDTVLTVLSNYDPVTFSWQPEDVDCLEPGCEQVRVSPFDNTTYTATVQNDAGCLASTDILVRVLKRRPVYVPNAFSPNTDGANDRFTLYAGPAVSGIDRLRIYDRWGELLYEGEALRPGDPTEGWDGTFRGEPMNPGVFIYIFDVRFLDGEIRQYSGEVTLLR
jgi:gliding motility-associated-like protein